MFSMSDVWRMVDSGSLPPPESAAVDEAILEAHAAGEVPCTLHFYVRSSPTVSLGYSQRVSESVDLDACRRLGVSVIRRGSGGGSIYTDRGQLIYALVVGAEALPKSLDASFAVVCGAVADALSSIGVDAMQRPVNDVEVGGKKVSGSAQHRRRRSVLQHGTVLVDTDMGLMDLVLVGGQGRRPSERVTNLSSLMGRTIDMDVLKARLRDAFSSSFGTRFEPGTLTQREKSTVKHLVTERYSRDEWNLRR